MNRQHLTYTLAVNHLADLSVCLLSCHRGAIMSDWCIGQADEIKQMRGRRSSRSAEEIAARRPLIDKKYSGPSSWDWRQQGASKGETT